MASDGVSEFRKVADRTARCVHSMSVSIAQLLEMHEGVDLRWIPGEKAWHCAKVSPIVWFDEILLSLSTRPGFGPWFANGDKITLTASNGSWIWIKTGQQRHTPVDVLLPQTLHEARWPD